MTEGKYAEVNGLKMYYEIHGQGDPLVLLPGGLEDVSLLYDLIKPLSKSRQVIAAEQQAHGHTADIDRPISYITMADDIAALIQSLGLERADVMGYSLGAGTALRTAIQYPRRVRKLILVSQPFKRQGWYPDVLVGMSQLTAAAAEMMKQGPIYQQYVKIAPHPEDWPKLISKVGALLSVEYNWEAEVRALLAPTQLVYADADSIPESHMAEFYALLGGGQKDAGWDSSAMPASRLAVLPGRTHYNVTSSPLLPLIVNDFLDAPMPEQA